MEGRKEGKEEGRRKGSGTLSCRVHSSLAVSCCWSSSWSYHSYLSSSLEKKRALDAVYCDSRHCMARHGVEHLSCSGLDTAEKAEKSTAQHSIA